jgi:hypothetical protein
MIACPYLHAILPRFPLQPEMLLQRDRSLSRIAPMLYWISNAKGPVAQLVRAPA